MTENRYEAIVLAKAITRLMNHWELKEHEQLQLLGMTPFDTVQLRDMQLGKLGLVDTCEARKLATHLLTIHRCLRLLYPRNPELLYGWVRMRNTELGGRTPLSIMLEGNIEYIVSFLRHQSQR